MASENFSAKGSGTPVCLLFLVAMLVYFSGAPFLQGWNLRRGLFSVRAAPPGALMIDRVCAPAEWLALRVRPYYGFYSANVSRMAGTRARPWSSARRLP